MIKHIEKPNTNEEVFQALNPIVAKWFKQKFGSFCDSQKHAILPIHQRKNILVSAVTGSGKTLCAFSSILNYLINLAERDELENKVYCVYVSPLKALSRDIEVNLKQPLKEMEEIAGKKFGIKIAVRTGDTPTAEKQKMLKECPNILISTPETLSIILTTKRFIDNLKAVEFVIVDEIHALACNKRGVHLSLSLERLEALSIITPVRIGLSATISPIKEMAKYLVGYAKEGSEWQERDCLIADVSFAKKMNLKVLSPIPDLINTTPKDMQQGLYSLLDKLIQKHKTSLIFTNTRSATERVINHLKEMFPRNYADIEQKIGAHHSSLSKDMRFRIENALREGKLKSVVCLDGNTKVLDNEGKWDDIKNLNNFKSVQSINNELKINENKILKRFKLKNKDKLIKLKTELGKEIICTKDHKFLTINKKGSLEWKKASSLQEKEFVATIRNYKFKEFKEKELENFVFENYPENYLVLLNPSFLKNIKLKIMDELKELKIFWKKYLSADCNYSSFIHELSGKYMLKIKFFKIILEILGINKLEAFNQIIAVSSSKYKSPRLKMNESLMRLLGFMLAEGYLSSQALFVSNKNKKVLNYYNGLIKELSGKKAAFKLGSTGTPILVWYSKFLSSFLKNIGFRIGRKATIMNIPSFVFRLNSDMLFAFLSGYFDGDGYLEVKKNKRIYAAGFSTRSKKMAEDISRLLLREGIISSVRSRYCDEVQELKTGKKIIKKGWFYSIIIIGGKSLRIFAQKINPIRENLERIKNILGLNGYSNIDVIPNLGINLRKIRNELKLSTYKLQKTTVNPIKYELGSRNISRDMLKRLLFMYNRHDRFLMSLTNSDLFWEKIKNKEELHSPQFVYNLEVKNDHNFIANGFLTKNCSTSLELGIDIGYIDLVVLLGSPKSIARALQRVGRAGHRLHDISKGRLVVLDRDDLVECAVMLKEAIERKIDRIQIPTNCLDVLAQQIYGMAIQQKWNIDELFNLIKSSYCYHDLSKEDFFSVISYLSAEYQGLEARHVYGKIWYDPQTRELGKRGRLARMIYMTNIGTIPEESYVNVVIASPRDRRDEKVGMIDEAFLERLKKGDVFVLGGNKYQFLYSKGMNAYVNASVHRPPTIPSWFSEMLPLSFDLASSIQHFRKLLFDLFKSKKKEKEVKAFIKKYLYVDKNSVDAIYNYFYEQFHYTKGKCPDESKLVIERWRDEQGKQYCIFHSLYGRRVNDALSRALAYIVASNGRRDVEIGINDNGFFLASHFPMQIEKALNLLSEKPEALRQVLEEAIERTEVFKRRFRHCATRSLMILRKYKGKGKTVGKQQMKSHFLLSAVQKISKDFPILRETRREVLEDLMDVENAQQILQQIKDKKIKTDVIATEIPSPFSLGLITQGIADLMKIENKIEFLKRMHKAVLERIKS